MKGGCGIFILLSKSISSFEITGSRDSGSGDSGNCRYFGLSAGGFVAVSSSAGGFVVGNGGFSNSSSDHSSNKSALNCVCNRLTKNCPGICCWPCCAVAGGTFDVC
jgi:hypothetical protein